MFEASLIASLLSGAVVGLVLGLIGGGGSILAVPLLVYVVGMDDPHAAIGTSAFAVAVSAAFNLVFHARAGTVKWRCALVFAAFGVVGAALGSTLGKITEGQLLLTLFGLIMIAVGAAMLRRQAGGEDAEVKLTRDSAARLLPRLGASGTLVGALSGFFGIGGGFLVVPGLIAATAMPLLNSIGSSLVAVTAFGATTAANYALAGWVDWPVAGLFIAGGFAGGLLGAWLARVLGGRRNALKYLFSAVVIGFGLFIAIRGAFVLFA
jgi:uncharacterized membrane protein YfcA